MLHIILTLILTFILVVEDWFQVWYLHTCVNLFWSCSLYTLDMSFNICKPKLFSHYTVNRLCICPDSLIWQSFWGFDEIMILCKLKSCIDMQISKCWSLKLEIWIRPKQGMRAHFNMITIAWKDNWLGRVDWWTVCWVNLFILIPPFQTFSQLYYMKWFLHPIGELHYNPSYKTICQKWFVWQ